MQKHLPLSCHEFLNFMEKCVKRLIEAFSKDHVSAKSDDANWLISIIILPKIIAIKQDITY